MMSVKEALVSACGVTADAARDAIKWVGDPKNADKVGQERSDLDRSFRRFATAARKLESAIDRPMCVGVFGPSQAGKSYLVSVLARNGENPLMARFGGEADRDFVSDINPPGERESTGIVTRFTINEAPHPEGFPVCLRLLSQPDLVKILGNTYLLDGDPKKEQPIPPTELAQVLEAARSAAGNAPVDGMTVEDMWDIQEYFQKQFGHLPQMTALNEYWDEACELAPRLPLDHRADLLAPLWGRHPQLMGLFLELTRALAKLDFAADAFCQMDALIPRETSIIDVATLHGLGQSQEAELRIRPMQGATVSIPRPVVTALVAELRIVMTERPWPFFDHTDLLDFPGARSRQRVDLTDFLERNPDALKEMLLRGKVAYLFDRYVAEQELTSMLLCIRPSNQEVSTLPDMVNDWISVTHGTTPAERDDRPVVLFFVLTMFDAHFSEKAGDESGEAAARFAARMHSSLTGFFGKAHEWPKRWSSKGAFRNCFWLRNPNFKAEFMIRYDGRREVEILPDKLERITELKAAYLTVDDVNAHFEDPGRAWEEALKLNDGGVAYLAEKLAPVCKPMMKLQQVAGRLLDVRQDMSTRLDGFYLSDDIEKRLNERRAVAEQIVNDIYTAADHRQFGSILGQLSVDKEVLTDHLRQLLRRPREEGEAGDAMPAPAARPSAIRPMPGRPMPGRPMPGGAALQAEAAPPVAPTPSRTGRDRAASFAEEMVSLWILRMRQVAESERICRALFMDPKLVGELAAELSGAARRLKLTARIAERIRKQLHMEHAELQAVAAALIGASEINGFVMSLGFDRLPEGERPVVNDGSSEARPIFRLRPGAWTAQGIGAERYPYEDVRVVDWVFGFFAMVEQNATSSEGQLVDVEQNSRIGQIIQALDQPLPEVG